MPRPFFIGNSCYIRGTFVARAHSFIMASWRRSLRMKLCLKLASLGAAIFLAFAGVLGCSSIVTGGGLNYFVGSIYAIMFGLLMLIVEVKDKVPLVSALYGFIDREIKFLTLQRGKGIFYVGVGLLVFFIAPSESEKCTTPKASNGTTAVRQCVTEHYILHWGVINVAALILMTVGIVHTFRIVMESAPGGMARLAEIAPPTLAEGSIVVQPLPLAVSAPSGARVLEQPNAAAAVATGAPSVGMQTNPFFTS